MQCRFSLHVGEMKDICKPKTKKTNAFLLCFKYQERSKDMQSPEHHEAPSSSESAPPYPIPETSPPYRHLVSPLTPTRILRRHMHQSGRIKPSPMAELKVHRIARAIYK